MDPQGPWSPTPHPAQDNPKNPSVCQTQCWHKGNGRMKKNKSIFKKEKNLKRMENEFKK